MDDSEFISGVLANPFNGELLNRLSAIDLNECYLTAGCLFQTIWNKTSSHAPDWGIKDYDVFYYDNRDLSWDAENHIVECVSKVTKDLPIKVEIRNQARVHLWYPERFGGEYPSLNSARSGIDLYLISCTCVGINVQTGSLYAPNGLTDLASGILRMNPLNPKPTLFRQKAESYQARWPWLRIDD